MSVRLKSAACAAWLVLSISQPVRAEQEPSAPSALAEPIPSASSLPLTPAMPSPAPATSASSTCPAALPEGSRCVPALTPIRIAIRTHLGSKISTSGQSFEFELADPVMLNGDLIIPAGTPGLGEVVHAKKSGGSGASGELVLAARYLDLGERRLRLRSLRFAEVGKDSIASVNALNVASAASPIPGLSLIGFFVKGKGIDLPEGTVLEARTAEPYVSAHPAAATGVPDAASTLQPVSKPEG